VLVLVVVAAVSEVAVNSAAVPVTSSAAAALGPRGGW